LGVEDDFHPARKAHPAFLVKDLPALKALLNPLVIPAKQMSHWKVRTESMWTILSAIESN
jgi:hypothetical protein